MRKNSIILMLLVFILLFLGWNSCTVPSVYNYGVAQSSTITNDWPMFHHDLNHTGYTSSTASKTNNTLWIYITGDQIASSSPAISDERIYIGCMDGKVHAINATSGAKLWEFLTGSQVYSLSHVYSSPAVSGGRVFIGSYNGTVYCLTASTGGTIWSYITNSIVQSSPAVSGGKVYVGSYGGKVYAFGSNVTVNLNLRTVDWAGSLLPSCSVTVSGVGSKTSSSKGWANFTGLSPSTYLVTTRWQGTTVNQTSIILTTSNVTRDLKCKVWSLTVNAKDNAGNLLTQTTTQMFTTFPNGTHVNLSGVNTATYRVMNGTFYFRVKWQGSWVSSNISTYLEPLAAQNLLSNVYSISFNNAFKDSAGNTLVTPPSSFKLICPNGTTTPTLFIDSYKLQNGTFRVSNIMWNNTDITPSTSPTFDPANGNPTIITKVSPSQNIQISNNLSLSTVDWGGSILPYGTVTVAGTSSKVSDSNGWVNFTNITPGTYVITVQWQGSKVNQTSITVTTSDVVMNLKSKVYSLTLSFKDNSGSTTITPSQVIVQAPNGTLRTLTTSSIPRAQNGTWTVKQIKWRGNNIVPTPNPTKTLTASDTWLVNTRVYSIDFSSSFLDQQGNKLTQNPDSFQLICPNGTTIQTLQPRSYLLQNGTFTWRNIMWRGSDVTPAPAPTFDPVNDNPTIKLVTSSGQPSLLDLIIQTLFQNIQLGPINVPMILLILLLILIIIIAAAAGRRKKKK